MSKKTFSTILTLSALSVSAIHLINKVIFRKNISKQYIENEESNFYEWRFGKVKYSKKGIGTPILLIHDLTPGSSSYEFHRIYDTLAQTNEVYVMDLLGYGMSEKPNMTYTNFLYVQLIIDFIKNIIGRKSNIIATGDSIAIAIMACHNDPEVFKNLFLVNPQSLSILNMAPTHNTKLLKFIIDIPVIGTFIYSLNTMKNNFENIFKKQYFCNYNNLTDDIISSYLKSSHEPDYNAKYSYSSYIGRFMNSNIIHALKEINHNIYILYGDEEKEMNSIIEEYIYYNSAIEKAGIKNTSHLPHLEQPLEFLQQLDIFL